jgi:uncharacterized membrane protein YuzA (DUF378 family)
MMMAMMTRHVFALAGAAAVLAGCALFPSDAQRGRQVADTWCSDD